MPMGMPNMNMMGGMPNMGGPGPIVPPNMNPNMGGNMNPNMNPNMGGNMNMGNIPPPNMGGMGMGGPSMMGNPNMMKSPDYKAMA